MGKVLVTGSAGFIGFHLVNKLLDEGFKVVGVDNINDYYDINLKYARLAEAGIYSSDETQRNGGENREYKRINFKEEIISITNPNYKFIKLNLEDKQELFELFEIEKFDYIVNLAAQAGVRYSIVNPDVYVQSNIVGFLNILEACRNYPVKHLVYASSSSVYGSNSKIPFSVGDRTDSPVSLYAATKKSNELMAHTYSHLYQIPTTGLRFFTVYGPWGRPDMAPMLFATAISNGGIVKVFNKGEMERDFTFIIDIVEATSRILKINKKDALYDLFNIGNGKPVHLLEFIKKMEIVFEKDVFKKMMDIQPGDVEKTWAETNLLVQKVKYTPQIGIDEGILQFVKWYRTFFNKY